MTAKQWTGEEIKMLLTQKNDTCISVILPLHNLTPDQKADKIHIKNTVKDVCAELKANVDSPDELIEQLNNLTEQAVFNRNDEGIGFYVSQAVAFFTTFPFTVNETILIDTGFHIKELLLKQQYAIPYNFLYIDEQEIRLYNGKLRELEEIRNGDFPMIYEQTYEYQQPSHTTSMAGYAHVKSFEKEKSQIEKIRHKAFLQQADDHLSKYLQNSEVLLLCGVTKYTSAFLNGTIHAKKIIGVLNGNYSRFSEMEFSEMVWPSIEACIHERVVDEINDYNEKIGEGLAEEGIVRVWDAVSSGRGETLLLEKNYVAKGFLVSHNSWQLYQQPPQRKYTVVPDAINRLLQMLLEKKGRIVFTEDGMLSKHQHIALVTRYHYFS